MPLREELSHFDESQWPPGYDDKPADPWHDSRYLYLLDVGSAQDYTFVTDTVGGRRAVGDLANQIVRVRAAHPGARPFISLDSEMMPTKKGSRPKPYFKVIEWRPGKDGGSAPPPPNAVLPTPARAELDDEIPF